MQVYLAVPFGQLLEDPDDKEVKRKWNEERDDLQRAIFNYLGVLREDLVEADAKDAA